MQFGGVACVQFWFKLKLNILQSNFMCQDHDRSPGLPFRWGKGGFQVRFAVVSPGTAEWEGNGRGQCGVQCFIQGLFSLENMIFPYLALFNPFLEEIC